MFKQLDLGGSIGAICKSPILVVFKVFEIQHNRISKGDLLSGCRLQCYNPRCFEFLKDIGLYLITANFCINPGLFLLVVISVDPYAIVSNVIITLSQNKCNIFSQESIGWNFRNLYSVRACRFCLLPHILHLPTSWWRDRQLALYWMQLL